MCGRYFSIISMLFNNCFNGCDSALVPMKLARSPEILNASAYFCDTLLVYPYFCDILSN